MSRASGATGDAEVSAEHDADAPGPPLPLVGEPWAIRVVDGADDVALVHRWNHEPHVVAFWQQDWSLAEWQANVDRQRSGVHSLPCVLTRDGDDLAYVEVYRVTRDRLGERWPAEPHDLGVHIAIGDRSRTGSGLGREALRVVAAGLLEADPACTRVYAEPDRTNEPSVRAFAAAGFVTVGEVAFPEKDAQLMTYSQEPT